MAEGNPVRASRLRLYPSRLYRSPLRTLLPHFTAGIEVGVRARRDIARIGGLGLRRSSCGADRGHVSSHASGTHRSGGDDHAPAAPPTRHPATTDMADRTPYCAVAGSLEPAHSRWPVPAFAEVHAVGRAPVLRGDRPEPVSGRCGGGVMARALDLFRADRSLGTRRPFRRAGLRCARTRYWER